MIGDEFLAQLCCTEITHRWDRTTLPGSDAVVTLPTDGLWFAVGKVRSFEPQPMGVAFCEIANLTNWNQSLWQAVPWGHIAFTTEDWEIDGGDATKLVPLTSMLFRATAYGRFVGGAAGEGLLAKLTLASESGPVAVVHQIGGMGSLVASVVFQTTGSAGEYLQLQFENLSTTTDDITIPSDNDRPQVHLETLERHDLPRLEMRLYDVDGTTRVRTIDSWGPFDSANFGGLFLGKKGQQVQVWGQTPHNWGVDMAGLDLLRYDDAGTDTWDSCGGGG